MPASSWTKDQRSHQKEVKTKQFYGDSHYNIPLTDNTLQLYVVLFAITLQLRVFKDHAGRRMFTSCIVNVIGSHKKSHDLPIGGDSSNQTAFASRRAEKWSKALYIGLFASDGTTRTDAIHFQYKLISHKKDHICNDSAGYDGKCSRLVDTLQITFIDLTHQLEQSGIIRPT